MLTSDAIDSAVQKLIAAAQPSRVILFGSYARGEADEDSDLDLLVRRGPSGKPGRGNGVACVVPSGAWEQGWIDAWFTQRKK